MAARLALFARVVPFALQNPNTVPPAERARMDAQNDALVAMLKDVPPLPFTRVSVTIQAPADNEWALNMVSWIAADRNGHIYLLQRWHRTRPVLAAALDPG